MFPRPKPWKPWEVGEVTLDTDGVAVTGLVP